MSNRSSQKIAKLLFIINVLPSIIASFGVVMLVLSWKHADVSGKAWTLLVVGGLIAQLLYFLQIKNMKFALSKFFWFYSMILNVSFIIFDLQLFILEAIKNTLQPQALLIIPILLYPLGFLGLSYRAFKQLQ